MSGKGFGGIIGGIVGAVVGFYFGGPEGAKLGWQVGSLIGGFLDPVLPDISDQIGPRLTDLQLISSNYGTPIPKVYGSYRIAGNIIWSEPIKETRHEREEEVGKGGSETYIVVWYTYSVSFAMGISEGPIAGIRRMWADGVKIYDADTGGYTQIVMDSEEESGNIEFYPGSTTQDINWLLQAANEDSPAYRNLSYLVFDTLQLENFSNRLPNISVEVISDGINNIETHNEYIITKTSNDIVIIPTFEPINNIITYNSIYNNSLVEYNSSKGIQPWISNTYDIIYDNATIYNRTVKSDDGVVYIEYDSGDYIEIRDLLGNLYAVGPKLSLYGFSTYTYCYNKTFYSYYNNTVLELYNTVAEGYLLDTVTFSTDLGGSTVIYDNINYRDFFISSDILYTFHTTEQKIVLLSIEGLFLKDITYTSDLFPYTPGTPLTSSYIRVNSSGVIYIFVWYADGMPIVHKITELDTTIYPKLLSEASLTPEDQNFDVYGLNYYIQDSSSDILNILKSYNPGITNPGVTLSYILDDIFDRSDVSSVYYDTTECDDNVIGYCITRPMSGRAAINILQQVYLFDLVEDNFIIGAKKRRTESVAYILQDNIVDDFLIIRKLETELPKKVSINYINQDIDYQQGSQFVERIDGSIEHSISIDAPIVLTDTYSKQLLEILLYTTWLERNSFKFSIPTDYTIQLAEIISVTYKDITHIMKVVSIIQSGQTFEIVALSNTNTLITSDAIASSTSEGFLEYNTQLIGPTKLIPMNIPTLHNDYLDYIGFMYVASGYIPAWSGCVVSKSDNNGLEYNTIGSKVTAATLGYTTTILPEGNINIMDKTSQVTIRLYNGSLYSSTYQTIIKNNSTNYIMIGSEILQFIDVVENIDGTYTISDLIRGLLGTEWAIGTHSTLEDVVLLEENISVHNVGINTTALYKATSFGYSIEDTKEQEFTYTAVNLIPLSPSYVKMQNNIITWYRRDRSYSTQLYRLRNSDENSYKIEFLLGGTSKGVIYTGVLSSSIAECSYTYGGEFDPIDSIRVSQYSPTLLDYGYYTEELV